ncbi:hypothetical protein [Microcoleus sp. A003_D6]|uniref:hypothetical protein n=1 Tax=Microcoleus sp. A003_D6 TaxID=3055266 RepID=UPI002FD14C29
MPVPLEIQGFCGTGILPVANTEKLNRQDACSTRVSMFCGTGILPVANTEKLNLKLI